MQCVMLYAEITMSQEGAGSHQELVINYFKSAVLKFKTK